MKITHEAYGKWQNCIKLANAEIAVIVTLDAGPRIIRFGFINGKNEFAEFPDEIPDLGNREFRSYGGHRLWAAPEVQGWTNHPDNDPVEWKEKEGDIFLTAPVERGTKLQKQFSLRLDPEKNHLRVIHTITNCSKAPLQIAPWGITVMASGGRLIIPQEPFIPHEERLLPVRPIVLWGYTDMRDPRYTWGSRFIQVRQDPKSRTDQKFGALVSKGWAAYTNGDRVFLKRFGYSAKASYADLGCNAEFFTNQQMLEVESLGPLAPLKPGKSVTHREDWYLFRGIDIGDTDEKIEKSLAPLLKTAAL